MAGEEKTVGESLTKLVGTVPNIVAAVSFLVLVLAFVHEWAYFHVIGGQNQSLLSITDYFNSAVGWLPWVGVGLAIATLMRLTDVTRHIPDDAKSAFYRKHKIRWVFERLPYHFVFWSLVLAGAFQFLFGDWYTRAALEFLVFFIWGKIFQLLAKQESIVSIVSKDVAYIIGFGPLFLAMAYIGGMSEGAAAIAPDKESNAIGRLKKEYRERDWIALRILSNGVLLRDFSDRNRIRFIRWEEIASFDTKIVQPNRNGLVCRLTGRTCMNPAAALQK
jgi:hypothetical protein